MKIDFPTVGIAEKISAWWTARKDANKQLEALGGLSKNDLQDIAADCGLTVDRLLDMVRAGPHASDEMLEMMQALGIDPEEVRLTQHNLMTDMQVVCAQCGAKGTCHQHLRDGEADKYPEFCGNAESLTALRQTVAALVN